MRHSPFVTTNPHTLALSGQHDPVAPPRHSPNPSERKSANADPRRTLGTNSANSGNVPDSSSPRRPSQATTRHAAEKRPPLLRTLENAAGTTPAETAKANFVTTDPHTLYHTIDRRSLHFLFLYILTPFHNIPPHLSRSPRLILRLCNLFRQAMDDRHTPPGAGPLRRRWTFPTGHTRCTGE